MCVRCTEVGRERKVRVRADRDGLITPHACGWSMPIPATPRVGRRRRQPVDQFVPSEHMASNGVTKLSMVARNRFELVTHVGSRPLGNPVPRACRWALARLWALPWRRETPDRRSPTVDSALRARCMIRKNHGTYHFLSHGTSEPTLPQ